MERSKEISNVLILDNGSSEIKIGYGGSSQSLRILGNFVAKPKGGEKKNYIGDLSDAKEKLASIAFRRPFDRGYLINWDLEKDIWDYAFSVLSPKVYPNETELLITEPPFNPVSIRKIQNEVIFEDYGFSSYHATQTSTLSMYNQQIHEENTERSICTLVVDSGYSFSHIIPYFDQNQINYGVKRVNIGGKALTNYLKEIVSYRHWNVMEETYLMNNIKERLCYISLSYLRDLEICKKQGTQNSIKREYVLPDYVNHFTGYIKDGISKMEVEGESKPRANEQILRMNSERIAVPELLFQPSDIGINQAGLAEAIVQSVQSCHSDLHHSLYGNIILTGGNTLFPNFKERLFQDLRKLVPDKFEVQITLPVDPITYGWHGGEKLVKQSFWKKLMVSKAEYEEYGHSICFQRFFN